MYVTLHRMTTLTLPSTRRWWHWLVLLVAFPLSGLAASLLVGPVLSVPAAVAGGVVAGLGLGFAGALAFRQSPRRWVPATVVGLVVGTVVSVLVPVVGPLLQGLALGVAQAAVRPPAPALWAVATAVAWTAAWGVSLVVAIGDEPGFVTFGLSGALLYCAAMLATVLVSARVTR